MKQLSMSLKETGLDISNKMKNKKYIEVREKLDKLKYKFHFDSSNLQLIDLLVNDIFSLQQERENLKKEKASISHLNDANNLNSNAFKQENIKLVKENNELIRQNVELSKNIYTSNSSKQMEIKRLNEEKADFKFMLGHTKSKLETIVKENFSLKNKLKSLLNKIYDANLNENSLRILFDNDQNLKKMENLEKVEADTRKAILQRSNETDMFSNSKKNQNDPSEVSVAKSQNLSEGVGKSQNFSSNDNDNNTNNNDFKMGIYVKQRNIKMNNTLDFSNNSLKKINDNKDLLKEIVMETFGKAFNQKGIMLLLN